MDPWVWWVIAAVLLVIVEVTTLDLTFVMLAGGALAGGVVVAVGGGVALAIAAAIVTSVALLGVVRPIALRHLKHPPEIVRTGVAALVGSRAVVVERVDAQNGRVKLGGEVWSARSYDDTQVIEPGSTVDVIEIKGATALVYESEAPWKV